MSRNPFDDQPSKYATGSTVKSYQRKPEPAEDEQDYYEKEIEKYMQESLDSTERSRRHLENSERTGVQTAQATPWEATDQQIDDNLDMMSSPLHNLRPLGSALGIEIEDEPTPIRSGAACPWESLKLNEGEKLVSPSGAFADSLLKKEDSPIQFNSTDLDAHLPSTTYGRQSSIGSPMMLSQPQYTSATQYGGGGGVIGAPLSVPEWKPMTSMTTSPSLMLGASAHLAAAGGLGAHLAATPNNGGSGSSSFLVSASSASPSPQTAQMMLQAAAYTSSSPSARTAAVPAAAAAAAASGEGAFLGSRLPDIDFNRIYEQRLIASVRWLITRAFEKEIPDKLRQVYHEDRVVLSVAVQTALTNGSLYRQAAARIFEDVSMLQQPVDSILSALAQSGHAVSYEKAGIIMVTEVILCSAAPFNQTAHITMIDALMGVYVRRTCTIDRVVDAVSRYTSVDEQERPMDSTDALLFWINKICLLIRDDVEKNGQPLKGGSNGSSGVIPEMEDLYEDLCDGCCAAALVSFYASHKLELTEICFNDPMSMTDGRYNLLLLQRFCDSLPSNPWHFSTEDILYMHESMQVNVNAFLTDLFDLFEPCRADTMEQSPPSLVASTSSPRRFVPIAAIPDLRANAAARPAHPPKMPTTAPAAAAPLPPGPSTEGNLTPCQFCGQLWARFTRCHACQGLYCTLKCKLDPPHMEHCRKQKELLQRSDVDDGLPVQPAAAPLFCPSTGTSRPLDQMDSLSNDGMEEMQLEAEKKELKRIKQNAKKKARYWEIWNEQKREERSKQVRARTIKRKSMMSSEQLEEENSRRNAKRRKAREEKRLAEQNEEKKEGEEEKKEGEEKKKKKKKERKEKK